jgi:hypothetical protein
MMMARSGLDAWKDRLQRIAREAMEEMADVGETVTRDNRGWQDDTHSAEESITGVEVKDGNYRKNFHAINWQQAQKRGSPKYGTPGSNFVPVSGTSVRFDDEDEVAVVTGWVKYLPILEHSPKQGTHTFERSLNDMESVGDRILASAMRKV